MSKPRQITIEGRPYRVLRWDGEGNEAKAEIEPEDPINPYLDIAAHLCVEIWNSRNQPVPNSFFGDRQDALPPMLDSKEVRLIRELTGCVIEDLSTYRTLDELALRLENEKALRPVGPLHRARSYDVAVEVTRIERRSTTINVTTKRAWSEHDAEIRALSIAQAKEGNINFSDAAYEDHDYERQVESIEPID